MPAWDKRLYKYQQETCDFIEDADGRCLIGHDMGLGKTPISLVWTASKPDIEKVLIVTQASIVHKWMREIDTWMGRGAGIIAGYKARRPRSPILVCSYAVMAARFRELEALDWDLIIWDESHALKSNPRKVKRVAAAKKLKSKYMLALSGTPFLNRPIELFNVLDMLEPGRWNFWSYFNRYCGGMDHIDGPGRGATNIAGLRKMLEGTMIRRLKSEIRDQLPSMTRVLLPVDIHTEEYRAELKGINRKNALTKITNLYHIVGREKAKIAVEWAHDFFAQSEPNVKLVLAAHHLDVIQYLRKELMQYGATWITGDVSQADRDTRIAAFQGKSRPRCIVINRSGGEGIDLFGKDGTDASTLLFVERQWGPALEAQIEGRLDRVGQRSPVTSWYLSAVGTFDEEIGELVASKWDVLDAIIGMEDIKTTVIEGLM